MDYPSGKSVENAHLLFQHMRIEGTRLVTAESCTGGLIAKLVSDFPGSSSVLWGSFVTYCNEAKMKLLSVKSETLDRFDAVSSETVDEMSRGALENSGADLALSVSGIAGPGGGTDLNPVGSVWICALSRTGNISVQKFLFSGDRNEVREKAAAAALNMGYNLISKD